MIIKLCFHYLNYPTMHFSQEFKYLSLKALCASKSLFVFSKVLLFPNVITWNIGAHTFNVTNKLYDISLIFYINTYHRKVYAHKYSIFCFCNSLEWKTHSRKQFRIAQYVQEFIYLNSEVKHLTIEFIAIYFKSRITKSSRKTAFFIFPKKKWQTFYSISNVLHSCKYSKALSRL